MNYQKNIAKKSSTKTNFVALVLLGIICSAITIIMIDKMDLPGPYRDNVGRALGAKQFLEDEFPFKESGTIKIFGKVFPLNSYYNGLSSFYLFLVPTIAVGGYDVGTVRIHGIMVVVLSTIFTYLFSKEAFNYKVGLIAAALFGLLPATVFFGKFPTWTSLTLVLWFISSLYFLIKWKSSEKRKYLVIAFILLGIGLSEKIIFMWVIIALGIALIVFRPKIIRNFKNFFWATGSLIVGSTILIVSFFNRPLYYFETLLSKSTSTLVGHSNLNVNQNMLERFFQFNYLLEGSTFPFFGDTHANSIFLIFFIISVIGTLILSFKTHNLYFRNAYFVFLILIVMLTISSFSVTNINSSQLVILLPLPPIIIGIFIVALAKRLESTKKRIFSLPMILGITAFLIAGNLIIIDQYKSDLERTGGVGLFSNTIIEMTHFLEEKNYTKILALDWGPALSIHVSSGTELNPKAAILNNHDSWQVSYYKRVVTEALKDPDTVYIKYYRDIPADGSWQYFSEVLNEHNKKLILIKTFQEWDGTDSYYLYKAL